MKDHPQKEFLRIPNMESFKNIYPPIENFILRILTAPEDSSDLFKSKSFVVRSLENPLEHIQSILKEPLKFLKDPSWSFLALKALKEPFIEVYTTTFKNGYKDAFIHKITKDSIKEIVYEEYGKNLDELLEL